MTKSHATPLSSVLQVLPPIPDLIKRDDGFTIDTTGNTWALPRQLSGGLLCFEKLNASPNLKAVIKSYIAHLLEDNKSIGHVANTFMRLAAIDWEPLNAANMRGNLSKSDVLAICGPLKEKYPTFWDDYLKTIRRMYRYAAKMGVPGFDRDVAFALSRIKFGKKPSTKVILTISPGARRTKASLNRNYYDDATMVEIEAALIKANRLRRQGDSRIELAALVLTWLAMDYGQRPLTYAKLRESHYSMEVTEQTKAYFIRLPVCKWRHRRYISETKLRPVNLLVGILLEELINQNHAKREAFKLNQSLDWPLFPIDIHYYKFKRKSAPIPRNANRSSYVPNVDPSIDFHRHAGSLTSQLLRPLFEILQIKDRQGGILKPTFSSFRDTFETNLERLGVPLEERAEAMGQRTLQCTNRYGRRGVEFVAELDAKCGEAHQALVAPFHLPLATPEDAGEDIPFIDPDTGILLGKHGRCGCPGSPCGMSGSVECYLCEEFRALEDGPHERILDWMLKKREELIAKGHPERQWRRYDSPIQLCTLWIERIDRHKKVRLA